jgi:hypothetical protein
MSNQTYAVKRGGGELGAFSIKELAALFAKGKLLATDEVCHGPGNWQFLEVFLKNTPVPAPSPVVASLPPIQRQPGYYVTYKGQRHGPLELSKIKAMIDANLLDSSATLESVLTPGKVVRIDTVISIVPPPLPAPSTASAANNQATFVSPVPSLTAAQPAKPKVSYMSLWLKSTLWIYLIMAVVGFLANNLAGLAVALGAGLILAPIKGAFWAWIIWLIKK